MLVPFRSRSLLQGRTGPLKAHADKPAHPFILKDNQESPVNQTYMSKDCGEKPEFPEKSHRTMG